MRKILISILVGLLLIGSAFFMVNGMSKLKIQGFKGLDEKNDEVEQKISELSNIISVTFDNTSSNLKRTVNTLQGSKTEYENQAILSSSNNSSYVSQLETYDIDYLWTKLGNYAKEEGVIIKIDLVASGTSSNLYNLNFSVNGEYVNVTNFIYDIENDSKLGFKIDEFKMGAVADNTITSSFSCKDIPISVGKIETAGGTSDGNTTSSMNEGNTTSTPQNPKSNTNTNTSNTNNTTSTNTNTTSGTTKNTTNTNNDIYSNYGM